MPEIWIPSLLRKYADGATSVPVCGQTVAECLDDLDKQFPGIRERLCPDDDLLPSLSLAVDGRITRRGLKARVGENSEIHFLPAIAGG
ncbi:MAG: MoaD/ThiS family protein [Anaerolineae bacterium]|nr:MoaD/ThiS family protein [Anaerolineae bacterium]